jgi:hypothetical protein
MGSVIREDLIKSITDGNKDFEGWDLSGLDLNGLNFFGANLKGANLEEVKLKNANLEGAKLPKWMKADSIWGKRTQVEFVRKNIRHYMAKYFAKHNARIEGLRSYGMSTKGLKHLPDISLN